MLHEEKLYRHQTNAQFCVFNFLQFLKHIVICILYFQKMRVVVVYLTLQFLQRYLQRF